MSATRFDPKAFLTKVGEGKTITRYKPGEIIFKQGEPAGAVYYLQYGNVKESVVSDQGREAVVGMLEPGLFFGTACLDGSVVRTSTAMAVKASMVTAITKEAMNAMLNDRLEFAQLFRVYQLHLTSRLEADKIDLMFNSAEKRLARVLLILARYGDGSAPQKIGANISQELIAEMVGTTRPRVNYFMIKFRKLGYIKYNGGIEVSPALLSFVLNDMSKIENAD
jgi:CRP/FNR family cyclic AMP-dependent transcriptional regulator